MATSTFHLSPQRPIWTYMFAWLLLAPILYLAVYGAFSIDHADYNNAVAGEYGTLLAGHSKVIPMLEIAVVYGVIGVASFLHFEALLGLCAKFPSLLALPVLAIASTAWSQDPVQSFLFAALAFAATIFAFYLTVRLTEPEQLELVMLAGLVVLLSSIVLAVFAPSIGVMQLDGKGAWQGLFNHKNRCAMGMAFLLTAAFFIPTGNAARQLLRWGFIVLSLFLIAMTQSRTGWLIAGMLLLFVVALNFFTRVSAREKFLFTALVSVLVLLGVFFVGENYGTIARSMGKDPTLTGRLVIWKAVMSPIFKRPLLGFGYSAFWLGSKGESVNVVLETGFRNLANAENGILQLWLELGFVGVAIFLYTLFQACRNALTCLRFATPNYVKWYAAIIFLEILALVDGGKFMFPNSLDWILYVVACLGLAIRAEKLRAQNGQIRSAA